MLGVVARGHGQMLGLPYNTVKVPMRHLARVRVRGIVAVDEMQMRCSGGDSGEIATVFALCSLQPSSQPWYAKAPQS